MGINKVQKFEKVEQETMTTNIKIELTPEQAFKLCMEVKNLFDYYSYPPGSSREVYPTIAEVSDMAVSQLAKILEEVK